LYPRFDFHGSVALESPVAAQARTNCTASGSMARRKLNLESKVLRWRRSPTRAEQHRISIVHLSNTNAATPKATTKRKTAHSWRKILPPNRQVLRRRALAWTPSLSRRGTCDRGIWTKPLAFAADCQWPQYFHSGAPLRASFRPPGFICAIRSLGRQCSSLIQMGRACAAHVETA
jgi:hypothetical protein